MSISICFHVYADGDWQEPVDEFLRALNDYDQKLHVGIVGALMQRRRVIEYLHAEMRIDVVALAGRGWEQVTLRALHADLAAPKLIQDEFVLYAHTKGAADPSAFNREWRRSMLGLVVRDREVVALAMRTFGHDVAGAHWITPKQRPKFRGSPIFAGNFWIARTAYLRTLPRPQCRTRHQAEEWIGLHDPVALDLLPGWPGDTYGKESDGSRISEAGVVAREATRRD